MWGSGIAEWGIWWLLCMAFFIAFLCAAAFLLSRALAGAPRPPALRILDERFARGEIPQAEYEAKKRAILSGS